MDVEMPVIYYNELIHFGEDEKLTYTFLTAASQLSI